MNPCKETALKKWVLAAPLVFFLHFLEEVPGFVDWVNGYVDQDISQGFFLGVNFFVLGATSVVVLIHWISQSTASASMVVLWLSFIMLANGFLHVIGGIIERGYVPGLITAILLYIPYFLLLVTRVVKKKLLPARTVILLTLTGCVPMGIQGYMVFFLGSRLW